MNYWNFKKHVLLFSTLLSNIIHYLVWNRVIYDKVWNRKNYIEIATFLKIEWGTSKNRKFKNENKNTNKHILVAGKCNIILNFPNLDISCSTVRKAEFKKKSFSIIIHITLVWTWRTNNFDDQIRSNRAEAYNLTNIKSFTRNTTTFQIMFYYLAKKL